MIKQINDHLSPFGKQIQVLTSKSVLYEPWGLRQFETVHTNTTQAKMTLKGQSERENLHVFYRHIHSLSHRHHYYLGGDTTTLLTSLEQAALPPANMGVVVD